MFIKRQQQKNLKRKRLEDDTVSCAQEKIDGLNEKPSSTTDDGSENDAGTDTALLSSCIGDAPPPRVTGKAPLIMTSQKNEPLADDASSVKVTYTSTHGLDDNRNQRATATANHDTAQDHDHRSILERNEAIGKAIAAGELEEGIYRGRGAYRSLINRREGAISAGKHSGLYGPVRGSQHMRLTMRVDLNPEICKDYKETGYCGFGDTCIFLHDRSDYKSGWQLEKEWEAQQKAKQERDARRLRKLESRLQRQQERGGDGDDDADNSVSSSSHSDTETSDSDDENAIPTGCGICSSTWTKESHPVVTRCHHYFCESCALKHYGSSSKCARCNEPTNGIFNSATLITIDMC